MDSMIASSVTTPELATKADVSHELPQPDAYIRLQQLLTVLRDPHQVELDIETRVGGPSVVLHPGSLLQVIA
jgi:hypothetical protein